MPLFVENLPAQPETPEMREGTALHELGRLCIECGYDPHDLVARRVHGVEITPELAQLVVPRVERVRARMQNRAQIFTEQRFALVDYDAELWGTADDVAYFPEQRLLIVDDAKYGAGIYVEVERNMQAMGYALGALSTIDGPVDTITIGIDQPRREDAEGRGYRTWNTTPDELAELGIELAASVQLARDPNAKFTPGKHCQTCPGRGACDALHTAVLTAISADYEPNTGSFMPPPEPEALSPVRLGHVLEQAELIRIWLNGVEQFAEAQAKRGNVPIGRKLVVSEGNRKWKDEDLAMRQLARQFAGEVTEDDLYDRKALSPAGVERLVGKARVADFIKEYVTRPKGVALVKADDPRPAYSSADNDFGDIQL